MESWNLKKAPKGKRKASQQFLASSRYFLGVYFVYQNCKMACLLSKLLRGFVFLQGFLTWSGSLFSGSISASSEELQAVEGSNVVKGDEEINEEIDDTSRIVSHRTRTSL